MKTTNDILGKERTSRMARPAWLILNFHLLIINYVILASCSIDHELVMPGELAATRCEIILNTRSQAAQTRATADNIPAGATVAVWADLAADATEYITDWSLTADGSGGLTGAKKYFPADGDALSFYAMSGTFDSTPTGSLTGSFAHQVATDQTTDDAYFSSDLLYACRDNVTPTAGASAEVPLTFYHMLAKVRVALTSTDPLSNLTLDTLVINNGGGKLTFTPAKHTATEMAVPSVGQTMLGDHTDKHHVRLPIVQVDDFDTAPDTYGEAVVVPQTYTGGSTLLTLTLPIGDRLTFKPDNLTLVSGCVHTLWIEVDEASGQLRLKVSITPWNNGDTDSDPTDLNEITGKTNLVSWVAGDLDSDPGTSQVGGEGAINPWDTGSTGGDDQQDEMDGRGGIKPWQTGDE